MPNRREQPGPEWEADASGQQASVVQRLDARVEGGDEFTSHGHAPWSGGAKKGSSTILSLVITEIPT
jgi:hypothetical protein